MNFSELNADNFLFFAVKNHINPQALTKEDFYKDLNHFKYIKRLFKRYQKNGDLKINLLLNHFIILYNIFGDAATPMLFYKLDKEFWCQVKTFIVFLNRLPEHPKCDIHDIQVDLNCFMQLQMILKANDQ
jgi:hypothetical protein